MNRPWSINFKQKQKLPDELAWLHEPQGYEFEPERGLSIRTKPHTDFWQTTHYGFRPDTGHCLLTPVHGDFSLIVEVEYEPSAQYDQCGLIVRADEENWIKASVEYENESISRLGSVVTNLGYSDWATTDISSETRSMSYRLSRRGDDILIEQAEDGMQWKQMRIAHLHSQPAVLQAGAYACSPKDNSFVCFVTRMSFGPNEWKPES